MTAWLTRDWGLKLVSLLLAVGLWYYAVGEEGIEITRTVPLEIQIENKQMSILKISAETIQVTLKAPRGMLSKVASEEIRATHKIEAGVSSAGDYSFRLEPREIHLSAPYIQITKIEPEVIQITLDELIIKKLEISPAFLGEPAFGYKVKEEEIQLNPNAILVEGPKAQIDGLDFVKTKPVDLVGRIRSFRRTVELNLPDNVKALSEALIDVFIPIKEEFDEKEFREVEIKVLKNPDESREIQLTPASLSFVLKGSRRQLEKLEKDNILAYLDVSALPPGVHKQTVNIVLPEEVALKEGSDVSVEVVIKKGK